MGKKDRDRWDERYSAAQPGLPALPEHFMPFADRPAEGSTAIEVACGSGRAAVWLALQGVQVTAYDISPVAIEMARELARDHDVTDRCTFDAVDLDAGLPAGPPVDLVLCNMFRAPHLDRALIDRLAPNGTLAVAALSEVGAEPGRFRAAPGELTVAFADLTPIGSGEGNGIAWLIATKP